MAETILIGRFSGRAKLFDTVVFSTMSFFVGISLRFKKVVSLKVSVSLKITARASFIELFRSIGPLESPNPERQLLHESLRTEIARALDTLTPREADVVRLYFGLGNQHAMTLEEIGETFDLTRERVRQIKEKAIRRLKHTSRSKILKTYLG